MDTNQRLHNYALFKRIVVQRGCELLTESHDWKNHRQHVSILCSQGHEFKTMPDKFRKSINACPVCAGYRVTPEYIRSVSIPNGWELVDQVVKRAKEKYTWRCLVCSHLKKMTFPLVKNGSPCHECRKEPISPEVVAKAADEAGWVYLDPSTKQIYGISMLTFKCQNGHIFKTNYFGLLKGNCRACEVTRMGQSGVEYS